MEDLTVTPYSKKRKHTGYDSPRIPTSERSTGKGAKKNAIATSSSNGKSGVSSSNGKSAIFSSPKALLVQRNAEAGPSTSQIKPISKNSHPITKEKNKTRVESDSGSDRTPPPSIIPYSCPKKRKTRPLPKRITKSRDTGKITGFLGAVELTSDSEDNAPPPKTKKAKPSSTIVINLCSDEDSAQEKHPKKRTKYVVDEDVVVILTSSDEESAPIPVPMEPVLAPIPAVPSLISEGEVENSQTHQGVLQSTSQEVSSLLEPSASCRTPTVQPKVSSPFSAPKLYSHPRTIVFPDTGCSPILETPILQTPIYFSRTMASMRSSSQHMAGAAIRSKQDQAPSVIPTMDANDIEPEVVLSPDDEIQSSLTDAKASQVPFEEVEDPPVTPPDQEPIIITTPETTMSQFDLSCFDINNPIIDISSLTVGIHEEESDDDIADLELAYPEQIS